MEYQPPYGRESEGEDANYVNGNPVEGRMGSIPPAAAFEYPMRELVALISKSKIAPADSDLTQVAKAVRSQALNYATDTGSANNLSVAYDPPIGAYSLGLIIRVKVRETCTGSSSIDAGGGRVPVRTIIGTEMSAGDLPSGGIAEMVFDGTAFQLVNFFGQAGISGGPTTNYYVNIPYAVDVSTQANIIDATFALDGAHYTLKAGDPFIVRMAMNTNTGSSIARFRVTGGGSLGDKPIKANGGDVLLQGDMQKNDVVLFLFDGTNFWIQPNPLINADCTINVPSQYSTVENALLAIRRKIIAQNATVTILLAGATGVNPPIVYAPFKINHANLDRIVIRGQMKQAGYLTAQHFATTGNSAAARAADSANNIAMLRTKYGTEIHVAPTGDIYGVENLGATGIPTIMDMLITGPNYWSGAPIGQWMGVCVLEKRAIRCVNISCWGLDIGFYGGGDFYLTYSFGCGNFRQGAQLTSSAFMSVQNSGFFGNYFSGIICNQNSTVNTALCWSNFNGSYGCYLTDFGEFTYHTSQAQGNGIVDAFAGTCCYFIILNAAGGGGVGTTSPTPGYINAYGGLLVSG
jgi:hypothetical protein